MKRSSIFLRNKLSVRELELLKIDLINHSVDVALKIKNIGFSKAKLEGMATAAVERVLFTYKFGKSGSLGELVRTQVLADLRLEFENTYPNTVSKIIWPDIAEKKPFDRLAEMLQQIKLLSKPLIAEIFEEANGLLNGRQQKLLLTVYTTPSVTYAEICKQFGTRGIMTYREIKIIHAQLLQTLKFLEINL